MVPLHQLCCACLSALPDQAQDPGSSAVLETQPASIFLCPAAVRDAAPGPEAAGEAATATRRHAGPESGVRLLGAFRPQQGAREHQSSVQFGGHGCAGPHRQPDFSAERGDQQEELRPLARRQTELMFIGK